MYHYMFHRLASLLWDIGKQYSPRCDAAERGVPSGAVLFAQRNFIEKLDKKKIKKTPNTPKNAGKWFHPNDNDGKIHSSNMGKMFAFTDTEMTLCDVLGM